MGSKIIQFTALLARVDDHKENIQEVLCQVRLQSLKSWKTYHDYMKKLFIEFVSILITGLGLFLLSTIQVSAQPLVTSTPTGTSTDGVNISIDPEEPLPANGTVSISTQGAVDSDMNVFPPEGVTVIISNNTVTVTNQTVDIETDEEISDEDEGDAGEGVNGDEEDEQGGGEEGGGEEPAE
jgi:hypothetical protein